ncbi:MAG: hypothetical protein IJF11_03550 [Clostridia bacterium]|nr:hypothetical protein [Clostridia bacterium]
MKIIFEWILSELESFLNAFCAIFEQILQFFGAYLPLPNFRKTKSAWQKGFRAFALF